MTAVIQNTLLHSRLQPADRRDHALLLNPGTSAGIWGSLRCEPEQLLSQIQRQVSERRKRGQSLAGIGCEIRLRTEINSGHPRAKVVIPLDQLNKGKLRVGMRRLWKSFGECIRQVCMARGITLGGLDEAFVRQFENPPRLRLAAPRRTSRAPSLAPRSRAPGGNAKRSAAASPAAKAGRGSVRAPRLSAGGTGRTRSRGVASRREEALGLAAWSTVKN